MDYKKKLYKTFNFLFLVLLVPFALVAIVILFGKQEEMLDFFSDINFLSLTAYADKADENLNISSYNLSDAPIVITADDTDYIHIIGSFNQEINVMKASSVITIEDGYKGTILFGMNNYEPSSINLIDENVSAISIKGSGKNDNAQTFVILDGNLMISHVNNKETPIISVDKGSTLYINDMKLDIQSEKTGTVIGSKALMDSGNILFGKNNVGVISGGHIGSGMGGEYTGTMMFASGFLNFDIATIGSDVKNTDELDRSTLVVYPSNNEYIDEVINIKNIDNYFILENSKNIIFNEENIKKFSINNNGDENLLPYVDVSSEDMPYIKKINQLFLNGEMSIPTLISVDCNKNYGVAVSEGNPIIRPSDDSTHKFASESVIFQEDVNILLKKYEYYTKIEILKESTPLISGYTFSDAMEKGLKLRILNPTVEEAPNAQILENIIILSENLDFIVVGEDGNPIGDSDVSSFSLNNGEYIDVTVALRPGIGSGEYKTKIVINENKSVESVASSIDVTQVVGIGKGQIIFNTEGGGDIEAIYGDESGEIDLSTYLRNGENAPEKNGYVLDGWVTETGEIINNKTPIYKLRAGENKLKAKYVKIQDLFDISYNKRIKFYVVKGNIESLIEKAGISIKDKSNPLEERLHETEIDISAVDFDNAGVYKAEILVLLDGVKMKTGKEITIYVLKEPVIRSSEKIIIGKGDVETLNKVIRGIKGRNYIVNEILDIILEEEIKKVDIDYKDFNIEEIGNYEVNLSMKYTGLYGEKESIKKTIILVIHGVEIKDIK